MKSVLISIQPKWVEKICKKIGEENGKPIYKKSIDVRKNRPNEPTPIKCLIYCTYGQLLYTEYPNGANSKVIKLEDYKVSGKDKRIGNMLNGKVIGEFVCDSIEMVNAKCSDYGIDLFYHDCMVQGCLTEREIEKYFNIPEDKDLRVMKGNGYAWHISDLKIYDKPKELSEFKSVKVIRRYQKKEYDKYEKLSHAHRVEVKYLERPPQSWCYVEGE